MPVPPSAWDPPPCRREMPNPWKVDASSGYGRQLVDQHMDMHDKLIDRAKPLTNCYMSELSAERMRFRRQEQIWRPSFNELRRRQLDDALLGKLINNSTSYLNTKLDPHIVSFKKHRIKHPNFLPGKQEHMRQEQHRKRHQRIVRGDGIISRVDKAPPWVALRYGQFLRSSRYTKGGAPRAEIEARNHAKKTRAKPKPPTQEEFLKTFQRLPKRRREGTQTVMGVAGEPQMHTIYAEDPVDPNYEDYSDEFE